MRDSWGPGSNGTVNRLKAPSYQVRSWEPSSWALDSEKQLRRSASKAMCGLAVTRPNQVQEARTSLRRCIRFYNAVRPHSRLKGNTPDQAYFQRPPETLAA